MPTTEFRADVEKCVVTMRIWAIAVMPTMAMNAPKTMMKRTGRGVRRRVPNMLL